MACSWAGVVSRSEFVLNFLVANWRRDGERTILRYSGFCVGVASVFFLTTPTYSSDIAVTELPVQEYLHNTRDINKVRFSPNGRHLLAAGYQRVRVWDTQTDSLQSTLRGHGGTVQVAAFNSDGSKIVTGGYDGTVRLWDTENGMQLGIPLVGDSG